MVISGVDFILFGTTDLDRAREFYSETLGLEAGKLWGENDPVGAEFETGTVTIALMDCAKLGIEFTPSSGAIALRVEDFEAARAELESKGVEFNGDTIDSGVCLQAYFSDSEGNSLGIHHRYAAPAGA